MSTRAERVWCNDPLCISLPPEYYVILNKQTYRQYNLNKACKEQKMYQQHWPNTADSKVFSHLLVDDDKRVIVCAIPKVGSGYWRTFFYPQNPHEFDGNTLADYTPEERKYRLRHYLKAVFVRHPLERLWSAYNDKIVSMVPQFLSKYGKPIVAKYRENPQNISSLCAHDVTFSEFVKYVIQTDKKRKNLNAHWAPFYQLCFPCNISYDIIGKLSTFEEDIKLFFSKLNKKSQLVIKNRRASTSYANIQEAACRIPFLHNKPLHQKCLHPKIMLSSKWRAWQNIGVIPSSLLPPSTLPLFLLQDKMNTTKWRKYCRAQIQNVDTSDKSKAAEVISRRKIEMYQRAFTQLPAEDWRDIKRVYEFDMALFGYSYL